MILGYYHEMVIILLCFIVIGLGEKSYLRWVNGLLLLPFILPFLVNENHLNLNSNVYCIENITDLKPCKISSLANKMFSFSFFVKPWVKMY